MRRIVITVLAICAANLLFAQDTPAITRDTVKKRTAAAANIGGYDHLMLQLGYATWNGKPDSIKTSGLPRTFNVYFMFAFPFKTNPHLSVAIGPGIATDHIFFDRTYIGLKDNTPTLVFKNVGDTTHFKKYKLSTAYLEAPVELRYTSKPEDDKHSFKVALGAKVGTLLSAWVKGRKLADKNNNDLPSYTSKEKSKRFFNTTRLSVMGRVGYGKFSLFGSYSVNTLFKEGLGPDVRPMTIGLTLSGL